MAVITISGEPGTPTEEVAARLAGHLGFSLVDKARLAQLAGEMDLDEAKLSKLGEAIDEIEAKPSGESRELDTDTEAYAGLLQELIAQLAEEQDLVIVNWGAQGLFHDRPGTLHVQLVAPRKFRILQVQAHEKLSRREAGRRIKSLEKEHGRYLRMLYRLSQADPNLYDLSLRMDRLAIGQALQLIVTAIDQMGLRQVPKGQIVKALLPEMPERRDNGRYVNSAESEFACFLDFYNIPFEYEPRTFTLKADPAGKIIEAFTPDFYLPDQDLYIELTTMKQSLVTRKNRKVRELRRLYPEINIRIFYQRDFYNLLAKFGLLTEKLVTNE